MICAQKEAARHGPGEASLCPRLHTAASCGGHTKGRRSRKIFILSLPLTLIFRDFHVEINSVGDPDPQDPHVFRPPGSGSIIQRSGYGTGSFPFSHKCFERTEIRPSK
jgi:hypothetical protein